MSKNIPANITTNSIISAGIMLSFDTPFVDMYEKQMDDINVMINTSIIHFR